MTQEGQESNKAQEQIDSFIGEFKKIAKDSILYQYETKNRDRINSAPFAVRDAFDQQWTKVTGKSYYLPTTTAPVAAPVQGINNTERSDPRSRRYRAMITFDTVSWQKIPRRKIGKKYYDLFNISGKEAGSGAERSIFQNADKDRLVNLLSVDAKDKIFEGSKTSDHGEIEGPFDVEVEGYWLVQFAPQSDPNDPRDVQLLWEGQCLIIQRMKEVVVPGFYLEVADNATLDKYAQTPEHGRKKVATIQRFPYTVLREACRKEYITQKSEGDQIQKEKLRREENS